MTNLDSILKSRDITLPPMVHLVKAMVFPVVAYGCESWIIRKDEDRSIDVFELWYWRTLESDFDCREIQPVNPKERQCQGMFKLLYNCAHFTCQQGILKILQARVQQYINQELLNISAVLRKGRRTRLPNGQHSLDHMKSKRVSEKHLLLLH